MRKIKRCLFILAVIALLLSVAACSSEPEAEETPEPVETPTPTPTPTPVPTPDPTPEPTPEPITFEVGIGDAPLPFETEFTQVAGTEDDRFFVKVEPEDAEYEITFESDNEEIFTVEPVDTGRENGFKITTIEPGNANLIVTVNDEEQKIIVRVTAGG